MRRRGARAGAFEHGLGRHQRVGEVQERADVDLRVDDEPLELCGILSKGLLFSFGGGRRGWVCDYDWTDVP